MKVAAIQMASGTNITANLNEADRLLAEAASKGAVLAVLPENFALMGTTEQDKVKAREPSGEGQIQDFLARTADKLDMWIVGGTIPLAAADPGRIRAACLILNNKGEVVGRYDKIHMFDVVLEENAETYTESETIEPGDSTLVVDTPIGRLGVAVCYDLRFPEQFRKMLDDDMEIIAIPSAFTAITGSAHWESLLRARAIENLCYVIAAAQGGYHVNGRETHGDSIIIDPWGRVLDRLPRGSGIVLADIDRGKVANTRRNFPAVEHRRFTF